jgi:LysM repeat protein
MRLASIGLCLTAVLGVFAGSSVSTAAAADCTYEVKAGDTLGAIALRTGATQSQLQSLNPSLAKDPNRLRLGQVLKTCSEEPEDDAGTRKSSSKKSSRRCGKGGTVTEYEVASGDNLAKIADRHGVSEAAVLQLNAKLRKDPDVLRVGQTLDICTGERDPAPKVSKLCGNRTPIFEHEVVPGEHLGQIAGRYGVTRSEVLGWNASIRKNPDMLSVGKRLRICPEIAPHERKKITYTVAAGDTFGEIAKRYGLTRREFEGYQRGKLADTSSLSEGQKLTVWVDGQLMPGFGGVDDDKGVLSGGRQLPPGKHYHVKWEAAAWGTARSINAIQSAVADYKRRMPGGPKVHIGDISKRNGGKFPPHLSHQHGRDVDIGYVLKGKQANETRFRSATKDNLDVARTWRLVKALIDTGQVRYIFMDYRIQELLYEYAEGRGASEELLDELFQYPRGRGRTHGMIRHWKGHRNHFHVRFRRD